MEYLPERGGASDLQAESRIQGWEVAKRIVIEDNVWIGGGAIVLPGVTIGKNAVVGAGSVVTRDVRPNTVVAGKSRRADSGDRSGGRERGDLTLMSRAADILQQAVLDQPALLTTRQAGDIHVEAAHVRRHRGLREEVKAAGPAQHQPLWIAVQSIRPNSVFLPGPPEAFTLLSSSHRHRSRTAPEFPDPPHGSRIV